MRFLQITETEFLSVSAILMVQVRETTITVTWTGGFYHLPRESPVARLILDLIGASVVVEPPAPKKVVRRARS